MEGCVITMIKKSKLFADLRKFGATIKQTRNGHYLVKIKTFTYTLGQGPHHSQEYHEWTINKMYKVLKIK